MHATFRRLREAEAAGFDAIFSTEINNDALATAQLMGSATERIEVGTWVANIYLRHSYVCAQGAALIAEARTQLAALSTGRINKVPVVQGANSHEGRFFIPPTLTKLGYQAFVAPAIAAATGKTADQILVTYPAYDDASAFEAASAAFGDASFACTALAANNLLSQSVPTYAYEFDDPAASPLGAMHTAELKYLFNLNLGGQVVGPASLPVPSQMLADTMRRDWTNFARSSTPNGTGLPEWNPVSDQRVQR